MSDPRPARVRNAEDTILELYAEIERLRAALEPFARNVHALSLHQALGHIEREHLLAAERALKG